ncbi:MAG: xanthine dehydrogenase family protein subunit M [Polyangiales bacterium]
MFHRPESIDEALALKSRLGATGTFLAGGTDLVVGIRKEKTKVQEFIDLSRIAGLDGVYREGDRLRIGALCKHAALEREGITALAAACETVGGPQIRNLGTIGGQLGTASPAGDVSVALIALDADCEIASTRGTRVISLTDFFVAPGRTALAPDEMVLSVTVPTDRKSAFYKIGKRDTVAISLVMAAASVTDDGAVSIGIGCVAPVPFRPKKAEAHLRSHGLGDAAIEEAAAIAMSEVKPITDHRGSADYRRAMSAALVRRLVRSLR